MGLNWLEKMLLLLVLLTVIGLGGLIYDLARASRRKPRPIPPATRPNKFGSPFRPTLLPCPPGFEDLTDPTRYVEFLSPTIGEYGFRCRGCGKSRSIDPSVNDGYVVPICVCRCARRENDYSS